jgi:hypothetical protein
MSQTLNEMMLEGTGDFYKVEPIRSTEHRGDGSATHYYELPKGATELRHLIKHKHMEHGIGEAFAALYRLNDNGEFLRNLKKAKYYIEAEIEWYEKSINKEK